jgi:uncharacterized protein YjbJ (UPF0337 family)
MCRVRSPRENHARFQEDPRRKNMMKPSTEDQIEGKFHEVKGKIKEEVGEATTDPDLGAAGNTEKQAGKVQQIIGRIEKAVGA